MIEDRMCHCGRKQPEGTLVDLTFQNTLFTTPNNVKDPIIIYAECKHGEIIIDRRQEFGLFT